MSKNFTINELRENRARVWEQAKNFLDTHQDNRGMLSAEDVACRSRVKVDLPE